jgi:hypothetical protein
MVPGSPLDESSERFKWTIDSNSRRQVPETRPRAEEATRCPAHPRPSAPILTMLFMASKWLSIFFYGILVAIRLMWVPAVTPTLYTNKVPRAWCRSPPRLSLSLSLSLSLCPLPQPLLAESRGDGEKRRAHLSSRDHLEPF